MKKPLVLFDLSIFLEALLSAGSDSSKLLRRWLENEPCQVVITARGLRALEGAVLDEEFLAATLLDAAAAERWVAALALRVETVEGVDDAERRVLTPRPPAEPGESPDLAALAELSVLDRDSVVAAKRAGALLISTDPQLLANQELAVDILTPSRLLGLFDAM
jgi:hypothetical protein